ncbi:tRNA-uridine aminocarboxypropyltransferase [Allorhodopirellula solitaria]|nr:tRNA-uridine aminocarboxypropyltransferase [Allorhodopirellula solitaria]
MSARTKRCLRCFRPRSLCFCDAIEPVHHRTSVIILQHRRERFHPFNTARIVSESLQSCKLLVAYNDELAEQFAALPLDEEVGLLYPGPQSQLLSDLSPCDRPQQLVVLDGTWHQAKTLYRDIPRLHTLPQYRLAPKTPGRYRIRREPDAHALSTLEATAAALLALEPENTELAGLTRVFDRMIGDQLSKTTTNWRQNQRRRRGSANVPRVLSGDLENIVVAYGERGTGAPLPMYWTAMRLGSGERFECAIESPAFDDAKLMGHLRLDRRVAERALSLAAFRSSWQSFLRPADRIAMQHHGTAELLQNAQADFAPTLILKSINVPASVKSPDASLDESSIGASDEPGTCRANDRLQTAVAYVYRLNALYQNNGEPIATRD